jgi:xyloglucan-specific endo-beta-1,4-glucanase
MKHSFQLIAASLATLAVAIPTVTVKRADTCGDWDTVETGSYTVYNNLWGKSSATSGQQCFGVDSLDGDTLAWHTR